MVDYVSKAQEFMRWKAKVLGLPELADDWVLDWLDKQGDIFCKTWLYKLLGWVRKEFWADCDLCPFCQIYLDFQSKCDGCLWRNKHGCCNDENSFYWRTTHDDSGEICKYWKRIGDDRVKEKLEKLLDIGE